MITRGAPRREGEREGEVQGRGDYVGMAARIGKEREAMDELVQWRLSQGVSGGE